MREWQDTVEQSRYTIHAIEVDNGLSPSQLRKWIFGEIKPNTKSLLKIEGIMSNLQKEKRIEYIGERIEENKKKEGLGRDWGDCGVSSAFISRKYPFKQAF